MNLGSAVGYDNSTIEGIAAQAGVGKQTIYRWWPSKAALYIETYWQLVASGPEKRIEATCHKHLHSFLCQLFRLYKTTAAGKSLIGLISESTHNRQAADAIEQGLFLARMNETHDLFLSAYGSDGELYGSMRLMRVESKVKAFIYVGSLCRRSLRVKALGKSWFFVQLGTVIASNTVKYI